jgi:hypothetical protein
MSLAQGCGAGHRWDWPDPGFPSPGGMGVLYDAKGNDAYGAGVMAQGIGFVQGLGMLLDGQGKDAYDALYYAQGAGVHMGLALFDEGGGSDTYDAHVPVQDAALGVRHLLLRRRQQHGERCIKTCAQGGDFLIFGLGQLQPAEAFGNLDAKGSDLRQCF